MNANLHLEVLNTVTVHCDENNLRNFTVEFCTNLTLLLLQLAATVVV